MDDVVNALNNYEEKSQYIKKVPEDFILAYIGARDCKINFAYYDFKKREFIIELTKPDGEVEIIG